MKAQELRIGNYVKDRGGKILRIDYWERKDMIAMANFISGKEVHPFTEYVEFLRPIPLTEEWLLKLGLSKTLETFPASYIFPEMPHKTFKVSYCSIDGFVSIHILGIFWRKTKYVHDFQNMVYALFQGELSIKE